MTVDRCSLLSCLQVILMSTRWQVGKSLQLPSLLLLMFMFVPVVCLSSALELENERTLSLPALMLLHLKSYRQSSQF